MTSNKSYDDDGKPKIRHRLTHDLSFPLKTGVAINDRVRREDLINLQYGQAFLRTLHHIHKLRQMHPMGTILVTKRDLKDAYRRVHTWEHMAAACMVLVAKYVLLLLRLPFGSTPAPGEFCLGSEMIVDLSNDILDTNQWEHTEFNIPYRHLIPKILLPPKLTSPVLALPLDVPVPYRPKGRSDGYVDDMWTACLHKGKNAEKANVALDIAINATFRPLAPDEPLPRHPATSLSKIAGEGQMSTKKTLLGWEVNCPQHKVHLPTDKYTQWTKEIKDILHQS